MEKTLKQFRRLETGCQSPRKFSLLNRAQGLYLQCGCNKWSCPGCAAYKARKISRRFKQLNATHLVTFTLLPNKETGTIDEHHAKQAMRSFRHSMRRKNLLIECGWVREYGEQHGRLHFHALMAIKPRPGYRLLHWLPYAELQRHARLCGLGNIDIRPLPGSAKNRAVRYVTKYLAQDVEHAPNLRTRRFYCPVPPIKSHGWQICRLLVHRSNLQNQPDCVLISELGEVLGAAEGQENIGDHEKTLLSAVAQWPKITPVTHYKWSNIYKSRADRESSSIHVSDNYPRV